MCLSIVERKNHPLNMGLSMASSGDGFYEEIIAPNGSSVGQVLPRQVGRLYITNFRRIEEKLKEKKKCL